MINEVPSGGAVTLSRYSELDFFIAQAALALRHEGTLFVDGPARSVMCGPRAEPGRLAPLRRLDAVPSGEVLELHYGDGLIALAVREADDRWVLLAGSDVRPETAATAGTPAGFLRAAWAHSGLLAAGLDGRSYKTTRDLSFSSGSAVAQFVTGSKGKMLSAWQPIVPAEFEAPSSA